MTRDEIRSLVGGYATGSLTEAQRRALFEAALEDQELFDSLMQEQALKELLKEPGATERLIAALAQKSKPWWKAVWIWAAVAGAAAAVITGVMLLRQVPKQVEIAQFEAPTAPAPPPVAAPELTIPAPAVPPPAGPAPVAPPATRDQAPVAVPSAKVSPPPAPNPSKQEANAVAPSQPAAMAPPPPPAETQARLQAARQAQADAVAGGGAVGGFEANRAAAPRAAAAIAPPRFAFDYSVTPEGLLRVTPAANGFLTVLAIGSTQTVMLRSQPLQAGQVRQVQLPADALSVDVMFAARETGGGFISGASDPPSGTKSDPNPSPDSRLFAVIRIPR